MKKIFISIFLFGVIVITLSGCGFIEGFKEGISGKNNKSEASKLNKDSEKQFKDPDEKYAISVPNNWSDIKKSDSIYAIEVGDKVDGASAGIYYESKENFAKDITLDKFTELGIKSLNKKLDNAEIVDMQDTEISGYKAKTYVVTGEIDKVKTKRLTAYVELPDRFAHINLWISPSKFDKNKDKLIKIMNSFTVLK